MVSEAHLIGLQSHFRVPCVACVRGSEKLVIRKGKFECA